MHVVDNSKFIEWAMSKNITLDERYGPFRSLAYENDLMDVIELPQELGLRCFLISQLISMMVVNEPAWLWRRSQTWSFYDYPEAPDHGAFRRTIGILLRRCGVPVDSGTLYFGNEETDLASAISFLCSMLMFGVQDEVYLVPDGGETFVWFDSDGLAIIRYRNLEVMNRLSSMFRQIAQRVEMPHAGRTRASSPELKRSDSEASHRKADHNVEQES